MRDFEIARDKHWYRIPCRSVERFLKDSWPPTYLAFYQTAAFSKNSFAINFFSKINDIRVVKRKKLFPDEPNNEKSDREYYQILLSRFKNCRSRL